MGRWATRALIGVLVLAGANANADVERARQSIRTKQFTEAVNQLKGEARAGSPEASYLLGLALWNGVGVAADREGARAALRQAAEGGHSPAAFALSALLAEGLPAERAEAGNWLARAAAAGYSPAVALQSSHTLPLADARASPGAAIDVRFEIARAAARRGDEALLSAVVTRDLAARRGEFGRTLLFDAAEAGSAGSTRVLLGAGAVVEAANEYGETALMVAAARPGVDTTRLLLGAGAQVNALDKAGRSALFRAAGSDQASQIGVLIQAGARVDQADERGTTALDIATRNEAETAIQALRAAGAHAGTLAAVAPRSANGLDTTRTGLLYRGWPPLAIAAARDDATEIARLLAAGSAVDAVVPPGMTSLDVALNTRSFRAARALVEAGASLTRPSSDGIDALERIARTADPGLMAAARERAGAELDARGARLVTNAARRGDAAMARALLAAGAPVAGADAGKMTALMYSARGSGVELMKELLEHGAPVDARDARGRSALWYAAAAGNGMGVGLLLGARAPVDMADRDGITPLMAAIRAGSPTAVERLLAAGAGVTGRDTEQPQPLRVAVEARNAAIVAVILKRQPTVDATDAFGDTALMAAARNGDAEISAQLLAAGANARLRNRDRATASELAESRGFNALAQRLRD